MGTGAYRGVFSKLPLDKVNLEPSKKHPLREPVSEGRASSEACISVIDRDLDQAVEVPVDASHPLVRVAWRGGARKTVVVDALPGAEVAHASPQFERPPPAPARVARFP